MENVNVIIRIIKIGIIVGVTFFNIDEDNEINKILINVRIIIR